ncbi:GNAT family N-acetyltransferase [Proteinivorax hydrogeniformans]|uniref:GNAT family N-acetyltransferase n=1 Tax=Proteinivorax hydrogeniformans TaxID=1826727 RepID=A0AAU8HW53_9FIRM
MGDTIRFAKKSDKDQMLEICRNVWNGRDYLLRSIDNWLGAEDGLVAVVENDGEIRAFSKLAFLYKKHGWLEGLRVKEEHRGKGYAYLLTKFYVEKAKEMQLDSLRFATHKTAIGSIKSGLKYGFDVKDRYYSVLSEDPKSQQQKHKVVRCTDYNRALNLMQSVEEYKLTYGLYFDMHWKFIPIAAETIKQLCQKERVLMTEDGKSIMAYKKEGDDVRIVFYGGTIQGVQDLLTEVIKEQQGLELKTMLIPNSKHIETFVRSGFHERDQKAIGKEPNALLFEFNQLK